MASDHTGPRDTWLVRVEAVSHFYASRLVFRQVDVTVSPGEVLLMLGPNGAGKSTLLQVMAGLLTPAAGAVAWSLLPGEIGLLGHGTCIYPFMTAQDNLLFWARMHGLGLEAGSVHAVLDRVGLRPMALERAGGFSRGMAQRLSLARVLLLDSRLLLLDEPATGLDTASRDILDLEITLARSRGAAVVWVSHDPRRDMRLADRVLVLQDRRVACLGSVDHYRQWGGHA